MKPRALRTAKTLRVGQHVIVSGKAGTCPGEVVEVATPEDLKKDIAGAPAPGEVREALRQLGIAQVAFTLHWRGSARIMFLAMGDGEGRWRDQERQDLTIRYDPEEGESPDA